MAYLNNEIITVDAVLTKKGRELLATNGGLNITAFALADDEVDYTLYQPNHPSGSQYYDIAIKNTPVFEPFTDETQLMKYKLVTLVAGVNYIPVITLGQDNISVNRDYTGKITIVPATTPSYNSALGYTAILANKNVGTIIGSGLSNPASTTVPSYIGDVTSTTAQTTIGTSFIFVPNAGLTSTTSTTLTIIGNESGGSVSIPVTVIVK